MTGAILLRQLPAVGEQRGRLQEERRPAPAVLALLLVGLFLLRVYYGLSLELRTGDDVQIYLLGLKFFTSGEWPFFGPDVIPGQIPGALQGLLVGVPLFIAREPEAPLTLLNLLSFAGLVLLGRYLTARFSLVPAWITYAWLLTLPWTLNVSTRVYNPSYLLFLSCFFFVGFFELLPSLTGNLLPPALSFFLLGFAVTAAAQIHLSWPLLPPFVLVAIVVRARERLLTPAQIVWLIVGAAVPLALLAPTLARYGFASFFDALQGTCKVGTQNVTAIVPITARFLSFASFELPPSSHQPGNTRRSLLRETPGLSPLALSPESLGLVHPS